MVLSTTYAWRVSEIRKATNKFRIVHVLAKIQTEHLNTSQKHYWLIQLAHPFGICKAIYTFFFAHHQFDPFFLRLGTLGHKQITVKLGFLCSLHLFSYILSMFFFNQSHQNIRMIYFLEYTFLLFTQLLIYTFNLSINCTVPVGLYTLNWKS